MYRFYFNIAQFKFFILTLFWFFFLLILILTNQSSNQFVKKTITPVKPYALIDADENEINIITKLYAFDEEKFLTKDLENVFNKNNYNYETVLKHKKVPNLYISSLPEDFSKIVASSKKKSLFIRSILPLIVKENNRIETLNKRVKDLKNNFSKINRSEAMWLDKMMSNYKVKSNDTDDLIIKVDIIPVSIALGQAAIESGWGTSRFAMEGNALYGQWSWKTGSGIVPKERDVNEVYEIKSFLSLSNSVASYMKNLNTHQNYKNFRINRKLLREHNIPVLGSYLYQYLDKYAVDSNYSNTLKKIIDSNKFEELENVEIQFIDTDPSLLNLT
ncbi:MAG: glucosaminidase domain-containing protein [Pelagibacterales bacterium]|nr:glucosaminidase domain-containing protein [Pelagibacterales bacterium]